MFSAIITYKGQPVGYILPSEMRPMVMRVLQRQNLSDAMVAEMAANVHKDQLFPFIPDPEAKVEDMGVRFMVIHDEVVQQVHSFWRAAPAMLRVLKYTPARPGSPHVGGGVEFV